jgi:hypothetical protein
MYELHLSISIAQHQEASFTTRKYGPNSLNIPIHFVMNFMEIHYNEFPIGKVNNKWMIEWTKIGVINHVRYTICTHVAFLFSFINKYL